jgi:hypothetical protein
LVIGVDAQFAQSAAPLFFESFSAADHIDSSMPPIY